MQLWFDSKSFVLHTLFTSKSQVVTVIWRR